MFSWILPFLQIRATWDGFHRHRPRSSVVVPCRKGLLRTTPVAHLPRGAWLPIVGEDGTDLSLAPRRGGGSFGVAVTGGGDGAEEGGGSDVAL
jgi:hypothetical protein